MLLHMHTVTSQAWDTHDKNSAMTHTITTPLCHITYTQYNTLIASRGVFQEMIWRSKECLLNDLTLWGRVFQTAQHKKIKSPKKKQVRKVEVLLSLPHHLLKKDFDCFFHFHPSMDHSKLQPRKKTFAKRRSIQCHCIHSWKMYTFHFICQFMLEEDCGKNEAEWTKKVEAWKWNSWQQVKHVKLHSNRLQTQRKRAFDDSKFSAERNPHFRVLGTPLLGS